MYDLAVNLNISLSGHLSNIDEILLTNFYNINLIGLDYNYP
jgi:hypothetical protein